MTSSIRGAGAPRARALGFALAVLATVSLAAPARADMGPCRPDGHDGLVCGSGSGAARVVADTLSPDKRFAFAWRDPSGPIQSEPDGNLEMVMVRLADGAVLARRHTDYWATGEMRVKRLQEEIVWSPDSRLAVRTFQQRFDSESFEFFSRGDTGTQVLDLQKLVEPSLSSRLNARERRAHRWSFSVDGQHLTVGNSGRVRFNVMLWVPKDGPQANFKVTLQVTRSAKGLGADLVSVRRISSPD